MKDELKSTQLQRQFNKELGERLKKRRDELKLTQEELAAQANLSTVFISNVERGVSGLSAYNVAVLANTLKTTVDFLLFGQQGTQEGMMAATYWEIMKQPIEKQRLIYELIKTACKF